MQRAIALFVKEKNLRKNSRTAYQYDLQQFLEICGETVTSSKLGLYQAFLQDLKPSAQRRKLSAVNQFLYFLYEKGNLTQFYKLKSTAVARADFPFFQRDDLSVLQSETPYLKGQLIALLIADMGLTPLEIAGLKSKDIQVDFQVLSLEKEGRKRVLQLPMSVMSHLPKTMGESYLFDHKGKPYSRQWFFNRLSEYTQSLGKPQWTAQKLREQYILRQIDEQKSLEEIAAHLGLKSLASLEKYREYGH